jgi:hypothetical protein
MQLQMMDAQQKRQHYIALMLVLLVGGFHACAA